MKTKILENKFYLLLLISLCLITILPLFNAGFFPMHDDTQVARVFEMKKALLDGQFPVRWVSDLGYGYGYPIFNFYAPLAYYVGGFFNFLGFNALLATKLMIILPMILASLGMYLLAKEIWGRMAGVTSAIFYSLAPYHAVELYVRGDISELYAYALIPFVFLFVYKVFLSNKYRFLLLGSLFYAFLILSHNLTALMVTPFVLSWILFLYFNFKKQKKGLFQAVGIIILGIILSAFYWLPSLLELKYTNVISQIGGGSDFRDHFVCLSQLWNSPWGFGGSSPGCVDGLSFKIGKIHVLGSIASVMLLLLARGRNKSEEKTVIFSTAALILSVFLTLPWSKLIWEATPFMDFLQFPWRFLILISFFSSLLVGYILKVLPTLFKRNRFFGLLLTIILMVLPVIFYLQLFKPANHLNVDSNFYTNRNALGWTASKLSDEYMPPYFDKPKNESQIVKEKAQLVSGKAAVKVQKDTSKGLFLEINADVDSYFRINTSFFPSWKMTIDSSDVEYEVKNDGIYFYLNPGHHTVSLLMKQTKVEKLASAVSLTGIVLLLIGIIFSRKRIHE